MISRSQSLPQALTYMPSNYDPVTTPWKTTEPTLGKIGQLPLAGKEVEEPQLQRADFQSGGSQKAHLLFYSLFSFPSFFQSALLTKLTLSLISIPQNSFPMHGNPACLGLVVSLYIA